MLYPPVDKIEFPNIPACGEGKPQAATQGIRAMWKPSLPPSSLEDRGRVTWEEARCARAFLSVSWSWPRWFSCMREMPLQCQISNLNVAGLYVFQLTTAVTSAFLLAKVILSKVRLSTLSVLWLSVLMPCSLEWAHGNCVCLSWSHLFL